MHKFEKRLASVIFQLSCHESLGKMTEWLNMILEVFKRGELFITGFEKKIKWFCQIYKAGIFLTKSKTVALKRENYLMKVNKNENL